MEHHDHELKREHHGSDEERKKTKQGAGKRLNDRQRIEIIQMAGNSKISKRQLADKFGVSEAAIRKLLLKKEDFLRRYYDTPEDIRDQRMRGKSTRTLSKDRDPCEVAGDSMPRAMPGTRSTGCPTTPLCLKSNYPSDDEDPWKQGLHAMLTKVTPFLHGFTQCKGPQENGAAAAGASADAKIDWVSFSRMLRDIRRALHRYPETAYQEVGTQAFIKQYCAHALRIPGTNIREMASTGLVVDVWYANSARSLSNERKEVPVLAFRADMDALPIEELNPHLPYCSTRKKGGKEHRKRKKRKPSTPPSSSPMIKEEERDQEAQPVALDANRVASARPGASTTTVLPTPSTRTNTSIGAPPPAGDDDDDTCPLSTAAAHMCGHDGHMAIVLGLCALVVRGAHLLPPHTFVRFLFQPAEEGPGGAMKMIEDGALTDVDEVYGLHNAPFPLYSIHVRPGPVMAHEVEFSMDICGTGGHGSAPHQCVDPLVAGAAVVQALQTIVSRSLSPVDTAVVSVTQFHAGDTNNVIPSRVSLAGTIRDFDLAIAEKIKERFATLVHSTCAAYGTTASLRFLDGYAPVINSHVETRHVQQIAMDLGLYVSEEGLPLMAAEDFAYFLQERKGCFFFLGTKEDGDADKTRALHSNQFDFNDKALPLGMRVFLGILQARMKCELYSLDEMQAFQGAMERMVMDVTIV
ncbi:hypothetical protein PsorP6_000653 [Peronosclerospora sorghi]|uniref:Uncharacterized protein n=1 Tax=Peronosclerospora sorghi TaxID=230839 RepID=A0ACC0WQF5_9STRA|nr:hypothetical protein PsorP6_000653 [Peronosclerospora sorghi]